jgi:hypothetical protein
MKRNKSSEKKPGASNVFRREASALPPDSAEMPGLWLSLLLNENYLL